MPNLESSFRALRVLHTAKDLFNQFGFHKVGVDQTKARLIEMCLTFQKDALKDKVFSISNSYREQMVLDKLKQIYFLHADLNGFYHLPFKAIFEIEKLYPVAYKIVVDYRNWFVGEIHKLLLTLKSTASIQDAYMFLFMIDGAMVQLLGENGVDESARLLDYFFLNFV
ncbi:hypothetical protein [Acinetobacter calcoaceticus]|uniref:hypothetical protein n=1 Tax=Acinetobacter calcoaceticus TaxID=471 RepID=UPI0005F06154|nr:hypothetical protein [Acinetobacter calcoaceticus]